MNVEQNFNFDNEHVKLARGRHLVKIRSSNMLQTPVLRIPWNTRVDTEQGSPSCKVAVSLDSQKDSHEGFKQLLNQIEMMAIGYILKNKKDFFNQDVREALVCASFCFSGGEFKYMGALITLN